MERFLRHAAFLAFLILNRQGVPDAACIWKREGVCNSNSMGCDPLSSSNQAFGIMHVKKWRLKEMICLPRKCRLNDAMPGNITSIKTEMLNISGFQLCS